MIFFLKFAGTISNCWQIENIWKLLKTWFRDVSPRCTINATSKVNYDSVPESTFGFIVDSKNMYGDIKKTECLPVGDCIQVEVSIEQILNISTGSAKGYIFQVNLTYPLNFRDLHRDIFLAPTKYSVPDERLSSYQSSVSTCSGHQPSSYCKRLRTKSVRRSITGIFNFMGNFVWLLQEYIACSNFRKKNWMEP